MQNGKLPGIMLRNSPATKLLLLQLLLPVTLSWSFSNSYCMGKYGVGQWTSVFTALNVGRLRAGSPGAGKGGEGLSMNMNDHPFEDRAYVLSRRGVLLLPAAAAILGAHPLRAAAEADALTKDVLKLRVGLKGLNFVLENWEDETTKCNYAQLDRALLARDKKEELLEAATTNALFDKDNKYMIIKCKRNPGAIKEVAHRHT